MLASLEYTLARPHRFQGLHAQFEWRSKYGALQAAAPRSDCTNHIRAPSEWHLQDVFGFETLGTCSNSFVRVFKGPGTAIYRSQGTCNSSASHRTVFQC